MVQHILFKCVFFVLLFVVVICKIKFVYIDVAIIDEYFRQEFHKLLAVNI